MIDHTASIWLVGCSWLSTSTGRQFWLRSLVLVQSSTIENDWVYLHTPKWLSWLVIFADNDSSGLVRIRLRLGIHFSFCFSRLPTRQGINALSQIESSARLVRVDMGLKWPCIIFVTNKRKSSLTWLLSNILNVKNRSKKWVQRIFVSLLLPGSLFIT